MFAEAEELSNLSIPLWCSSFSKSTAPHLSSWIGSKETFKFTNIYGKTPLLLKNSFLFYCIRIRMIFWKQSLARESHREGVAMMNLLSEKNVTLLLPFFFPWLASLSLHTNSSSTHLTHSSRAPFFWGDVFSVEILFVDSEITFNSCHLTLNLFMYLFILKGLEYSSDISF